MGFSGVGCVSSLGLCGFETCSTDRPCGIYQLLLSYFVLCVYFDNKLLTLAKPLVFVLVRRVFVAMKAAQKKRDGKAVQPAGTGGRGRALHTAPLLHLGASHNTLSFTENTCL